MALDVLWLTPVAPDRNLGGGSIRLSHLILAMRTVAKIHLVTSEPVSDPDVRSAVASLTEVTAAEHDWSRRPKLLRRARDLYLAASASEPREVADFRPVRRAMASVLSTFRVDLVLIEYAGLASLVDYRDERTKWVLTFHNLVSVMAAQEAKVVEGRRRQWLSKRDAVVATKWEREVASRYDKVIVPSQDDADVLSQPELVDVVENGVDVKRYQPTPLPRNHRIVFTGALYTLPNIDGLQWFCWQVFPLIKETFQDTELDIVGSRPSDSVRELQEIPGVALYSDVEDTRTYLERARVVIVPIRIGSGTRLKALEGLASGRPVIGTSIGLDGLGLIDGVHAIFADDPGAFARAVCRSFEDGFLANALTQRGRDLVETQYSWSKIGQDFAGKLMAMLPG